MPAHWFANPWGLWLLGLLPLLGLVGWLCLRRRRRALARLGTLSALLTLATRRTGRRFLRGLCGFAALALLIVGVAGPQWGRDWEKVIASGRDVVVVLDLSRSMLAQDVLPSRIERARKALRDLSFAVERQGGQRLALVVFAARAQVVCPLTHDYAHFRLAVSYQDPANAPRELRPRPGGPTSGTRIGAALKTALKTLGTGSEAAGTVLLISDGDDPAHDEEWKQGAEAAQLRKVPVITIGVGHPRSRKGDPVFIPIADDYVRHEDGTRVQTQLDEKPLREIAHMTDGHYVRERAGDLDLGSLFKDWIEPQAVRKASADRFPRYTQRYPWFFGAAFLLSAAAMLIGEGRSSRKPATPFGGLAGESDEPANNRALDAEYLDEEPIDTDADTLVPA